MLTSTITKSLQLALVFAVLQVQGNPVPEGTSDLVDGPPEGFTEAPLQWEVQSHPDGEVFQTTGTVEEVHAELLRRNPNYEADFGLVTRGLEEEDSEELSLLEARGTCKNDWRWIDCNVSANGRAQTRATREGIAYLRRVKGKPSSVAGPNACTRVSCSHKSAIWWCNHDNKKKTLGSFNSIANGAQCAYDKCQKNAKVKGQSHAKGSNWSVIVKGASC